MISVVDFLPTVLDITGINTPSASTAALSFRYSRATHNPTASMSSRSTTKTPAAHAIHARHSNQAFPVPLQPVVQRRARVRYSHHRHDPFRRLAALAETNNKLAARLDLYKHRVPEELYDVVKDPDCLYNLIDSPNISPS